LPAAKNQNHILDLSIVFLLSAILGARIFYVIQFWPDYATNWWKVFAIWEGGLVFYGGFILCIITSTLYMWIFRLPIWKYMDIIFPGSILGYGVGRLGCFFNGCCEGAPCSLPWAVKFPHEQIFRHPTQLYATFAGLLIFAILMWRWPKRKFDGEITLLTVILYSIYRFIVELMRINPLYFRLSAAQWISILLIAGSMLIWRNLRSRNK
jgi:phosphatidylglycerol:prolipoprotein diacylglycerol transferase